MKEASGGDEPTAGLLQEITSMALSLIYAPAPRSS